MNSNTKKLLILLNRFDTGEFRKYK